MSRYRLLAWIWPAFSACISALSSDSVTAELRLSALTSLHQHRALQYMLAWYRRRSTFMILSNDFSLHFSSCERGDCTRKREGFGTALRGHYYFLSCSGLFSHSKWEWERRTEAYKCLVTVFISEATRTQVFFTGCQFYHPAIQKIRCFSSMPYGKTNLKKPSQQFHRDRLQPVNRLPSKGSRHEWALWKCDSRFGHSSN